MTFINDNPIPEPVFPVFDYSSRDYLSMYSDLLDRRQLYLPEWTSDSSSDFGLMLLQMFSYVFDILNYYTDRLGGESFLLTATQPSSIINIAGMLDYVPTLSVGATVTLQITISQSLAGGSYPVVIPIGAQFATLASPTQPSLIFTTTASLSIPGPTAATPSYVGTVAAVQGITITSEAVGTSDGTVNQVFPLQNNPVSAGSVQVFVDLGLGPQPWTFVQNLIDYNGQSQVFTTIIDANNNLYVLFGDGNNGYVPPLGSPITASYMTNAGSSGNVGSGLITQPVSAIVGVTSVTNPSSATGGMDPESLSSIQQSAPASLSALNRAVTISDFITLALQVPGVQWAAAQQVTYQLVNLYIAPSGGGQPTAALIAVVQNYFGGTGLTSTAAPDPLVMANTTVMVLGPTYVPINMTINLVVLPNYGNTTTEQAVLLTLQTFLSVLNTGFGIRVSLGVVYSAILAVTGVNYCSVTTLQRGFLCTLTTALTNGETGTRWCSRTPVDRLKRSQHLVPLLLVHSRFRSLRSRHRQPLDSALRLVTLRVPVIASCCRTRSL